LTWFRVDDSLPDHPKLLALQQRKGWQSALALWTLAGAWCGKHLTDGAVPAAIIQRLGCSLRDAAALVTVGLWESTKSGDYQFHDWAARNPLRKQVERDREATRNRVNKHRRNEPGNTVTNGDSAGAVTALVTPLPSLPIPSRPDPERETRAPDETEPQPAALPLEHRIRVGFEKRYLTAKHGPPNQAQLGALVPVLAEWIRSAAPLRKLDETALLTRVLDGFFASDKARDARFRPSFLATDPDEFFGQQAAPSAKGVAYQEWQP
jgi:hypothetical protein